MPRWCNAFLIWGLPIFSATVRSKGLLESHDPEFNRPFLMPSDLRILALETSSRRGSIALLESVQVAAQVDLPPSTGTAQGLTAAIDSALRSLDWTPGEIQLVAVTNGPGSFTGLRVGVTTAKTFAYATGAKVVAVNTLDCIATQTRRQSRKVHVVIDAQRGDLFAAAYQHQQDGELQLVDPGKIVACREWLNVLEPGVTVIGPGLEKIKDSLPNGVEVAAEHLWQPAAVNVGRLAYARHQDGRYDDFWTLSPVYHRKSAAEEKLAQRTK